MTEKNKPTIDEMTEEDQEKHMEESLQFSTERTFKLLDDALDRDLDMGAVSLQMFHTAAFVLSQHKYSLDEMIVECKDAIKQSEEVNEDESVEDEVIDALHKQGSGPPNEA